MRGRFWIVRRFQSKATMSRHQDSSWKSPERLLLVVRAFSRDESHAWAISLGSIERGSEVVSGS